MPELDELRVLRERAKVRLEVAEDMERKAIERFRRNSTGYEAWRRAATFADEARCSFEAAEAEYSKTLAARAEGPA